MTDVEVPRNREAEQAVIGAVIQSARAFEDARRVTQHDDFWFPGHQLVWACVERLFDTGVVIDPMAVMTELRRAGELERAGGASGLHDLMATPWQTTNVTNDARMVAESAQARRALQIQQRISQVLADHVGDHDELMTSLARQAIALDALVDERVGDRPIAGLEPWDDFLHRHRNGIQWVVPNLIMHQDVWIILAGEGGGKSMLTRQICLALAAGIHPWHPDRHIAPRRTLHIDLENPGELVAEESRPIRDTVDRIGGYVPENAYIWHRPSGLDIRDRKDAMLLERAVAETGAEVVSLGSLYKAFNRRGDSWDAAAEEARGVFDRIRERYNIALLIEAHQPKGNGGSDRPNTPFGSQQWIGWASMGRTIIRKGDNMWALEQFRGDRGKRDMPIGLVRGGTFPWTPIWDELEIKQGTWPELLSKDDRKDLGL